MAMTAMHDGVRTKTVYHEQLKYKEKGTVCDYRILVCSK